MRRDVGGAGAHRRIELDRGRSAVVGKVGAELDQLVGAAEAHRDGALAPQRVGVGAAQALAVAVERVAQQLRLGRLQRRLVESHGARQAGKELRVGERLADRLDHRLGVLQHVVAVRLVQLALLEHRRSPGAARRRSAPCR